MPNQAMQTVRRPNMFLISYEISPKLTRVMDIVCDPSVPSGVHAKRKPLSGS